MTEIIYKTGDLLQAPEHVIIHGCNAQGVMGSGVAKLIREKWSHAYEAYRENFLRHNLKLGTVIWAGVGPFFPVGGPTKIIGNAITQEFFGRQPGRVYVDYAAVNEAISHINNRAPMWVGEGGSVAFPLIGAGLAGGHWPTIAEIIERESTRFQPVVYTLDGVVPD